MARRTKEIKNFGSLLSVIEDPSNNEDLKRLLSLINGVGSSTIQKLSEKAKKNDLSLYESLKYSQNVIPESKSTPIRAFRDSIEKVSNSGVEVTYEGMLEVISETGFDKKIREDYYDRFLDYLENQIDLVEDLGEDENFSFFVDEFKSKSKKLYRESSKQEKNDLIPNSHFNRRIQLWLSGSQPVREHNVPAAFEPLRERYETLHESMTEEETGNKEAHHRLLSSGTSVMGDVDLAAAELRDRLSEEKFTERGVRSALSQGQVKNTGENFTNMIVYSLSKLLSERNDILVDRGTPPVLKEYITFERPIEYQNGSRTLSIQIECDMCVFSKRNPQNSILFNVKTRMKEVSHISTMWKLFFDMMDDEHSLDKWGLKKKSEDATSEDMLYIFTTADNISEDAESTQGGDVEREEVRNLIAADASFFDYVFVSKPGEDIEHVASELDFDRMQTTGLREAAFHELGCLVDLIEQKYDITL